MSVQYLDYTLKSLRQRTNFPATGCFFLAMPMLLEYSSSDAMSRLVSHSITVSEPLLIGEHAEQSEHVQSDTRLLSSQPGW